MAKEMKLALVLSAMDKATAVINSVVNKATAKLTNLQNSTQKMAKNAMGFGKDMVGMGVAAGLTLAPAVTAFAQAEDAAVRLKTTMMDSSGQVSKDFAAINDLATKLGGKLPGTTADFQNMMAKLVQQGISTKAILGGVGEAAAYIGVQMQMPFEQAAEFAAKLQDATKTTEGDMLSLMDTIQKAYNLGVDPANMQQGFSKLSAAMEMVKLRGLEGAKALAPLLVMADQAAMAGEAAGNAYRKVFQASFNVGKVSKANADLAKFGVNLKFTDKKGEFAGIENFIAQLEKLKSLDTTTRTGVIKKLFGDDAETLQVVALLMEKGNKGYQDTVDRMNNQASLQQRVNAQLGTLRNTWDAAMGALTNTLASLGELIAPTLKDLSAWFGEISQKIQVWIKDNPKLTKTIMLVGGAFAGLAIGLGVVGLLFGGVMKVAGLVAGGFKALTTVLGFTAKAFNFVGKAVVWLGRIMMANPIIAIIVGIATAVTLIYYYWDEIVAFFQRLWQKVKDIFWGVWEWVKGWAKYFYDAGVQVVTYMWEGIKSTFAAMARWLRDALYSLPLVGKMFSSTDPMVMAIQKMETQTDMIQKVKSGDKGATQLINSLAMQGYNVDKLKSMLPQTANANTPVSSQAAAANGSGAINYQPQITIQGDATPEQQQRFKELLAQHKGDIAKVIREEQERAAKRSYSAAPFTK